MTKVFDSLLKRVSIPFLIGLTLTLAAAFLARFYYTSHQDPEMVEKYPILAELERFHNQTIDFRLRQRGPRPGTDDVAILTIDEKAIQKYGRWPWPRRYIAKVVDDILSNGASSISFDIIFSEKQQTVLNSLDEVKEKLAKGLPAQSQSIQKIIDAEKDLKNDDAVLTEVLEKHSGKVIMGAVYDEFEFIPYPFQDSCFLNIAKINGVFDTWENEAYLVGVYDAKEFNLPESWNKIILEHFGKLQQNISYEWLQEHSDHEIASYLKNNGFGLKKQKTINVLTQLIRENQEAFDELEAGNLDWQKMGRLLPKKTAVDLRTNMDRELKNYCYRYLTDKDELIPVFKANWDNISNDYDKFKGLQFEEATTLIMHLTLKNPVHHVDHWLFNIPEIREITEHSGTFNATQDRDGSIRRSKLFVRNGNLFIPSLAFKTYLVINDFYPTAQLAQNPYEKPATSNIVSYVQIKDAEDNLKLNLPTDHRAQLPINYAGPRMMFSYLSASEILDGGDTLTIEQRMQNNKGEWVVEEKEVPKLEYLKNKSFIFGATATGIYDLRVTPFEENYPGVETHANMLDNLIRQDYLKTSNKEEVYMPLFVFLLGLLFSWVVAKFGALTGLAITFLSLGTITAIDAFFIFPKGYVVVVFFPIVVILFLYTFLTFIKYFTEERKKKQLKGTFQKYVSPEIVEEILKDPSKLELGGIKTEMSVFFSDIRGFTTISEKLDPKALSDLLNDYLTPMTDIIFQNSGTLDKYMGDAIMAFFGAPIPYKDHAAQACRASLQQIEKLFELQKKYEEQGLPQIDIGIGVNTGEMSVGNMGSESVRNYTVMGDSVNLGARLEGINKQYGTRIIISEFTVSHLKPGEFVYREIDWVKVKGKNEPVKIYELIAEGEPTESKKKQLDHFNRGFELYHQQRWSEAVEEFNQALGIDAEDQTSQLYINRCQDYMNNPPGESWDGVFTMTTK